MTMSAERVARNDAIFREANEGIEARAAQLDVAVVPFICECADPGCTQLIPLRLDEYATIRSSPVHFVNAPGHDAPDGPYSRVLEEHDGYVVVEKLGEAADILRRRDGDAADV